MYAIHDRIIYIDGVKFHLEYNPVEKWGIHLTYNDREVVNKYPTLTKAIAFCLFCVDRYYSNLSPIK